MKIFFKYIGILSFAMFSFYYTDRVIELSRVNDSIMVSIIEYSKENDTKCREGYITDDGIVLGISGILVDKQKSYSNMKGIGYKKDLIEYKKSECILNKENNYDKYILKGNPLKNSVSLVIAVDSLDYIDEINDIAKSKGALLSYMMNSNFLENNKDVLKKFYDNNFLFNGSNKDEYKKFTRILKSYNKDYGLFCAEYKSNILGVCADEEVNTIKVKDIINMSLLSNIKRSINKGDIIFIKENRFNAEELSSAINYINGLGINIVGLNELLD